VDQVEFIGQTSVGTHKHKVSKTTMKVSVMALSWSRWPHGLSCGSVAALLLGLWVKFCWEYGCFSLVSVVCCQVEVSASGSSLMHRSPTKCVCVCGHTHVPMHAIPFTLHNFTYLTGCEYTRHMPWTTLKHPVRLILNDNTIWHFVTTERAIQSQM